ncbi:Putative mediator complex, subunit Med7 [Septoria linicola]|uniref:Mediator of RNA polymerase II transcription subunit 7 n=1 Tax=Septoria linicola TaxID=215465 RepID=A0A9Q9AKI6_9PEZI|nr:putative mediator complex, subunit Med7 [Septoria linicola]USW48623.1 Putative mediator complex, subunit Med7 [Septoria linicola]
MAEEQQLVAPFPAPPPFYQHFTKQNRNRLRQLRKEAAAASSSNTDNAAAEKQDIDILSLPAELRYLIPPPPPSTTKFTVFGQEIDLEAPEPTLAEAGIEQLYPSDPSVKTNPQPHLIALARSLLTTFLGLIGVLAANPELYEERVSDLQAIMFNMHSLINQYRPHQARESLIMLMEDRVARMRAEIRGVEEGKERVGKLLEGMKSSEVALKGEGAGEDVKKVGMESVEDVLSKKRVERQRATWAMLEAEMG